MSRQTLRQRRALARAERKREAAEQRYKKTRSQTAYVRLKDAVTKALIAGLAQAAPSRNLAAGRSAR